MVIVNYIFYHSCDFDGVGSASLICNKLNNKEVILIPCEYPYNKKGKRSTIMDM